MIQIRVRFFASLREQFDCSEQRVEMPAASTALDVWRRVSDGAEVPRNLLCARNQDYVDLATRLDDGDELAFFPPVTGG